MDYDLHITAQDFQVIWGALGEIPAKFSFPVMERLKEQVKQQEALAPAAQGVENGSA